MGWQQELNFTPYDFQWKGCADVWQAIDEGYAGIVVTAPPRAGKTKMQEMLIREAMARGWQTVLYTPRISLTKQAIKKLGHEAGLDLGIRAAGYDTELLQRVQIASLWTEASKVLRRGERDLHDSPLVLVDELHLQCGKTACEIYDKHIRNGAHVVGFTATPVDVPVNFFQKQIVATNNSQLRKLGQHVPCIHYGFEEPDLRHVKRIHDISAAEISEAMHIWQIFGSVFGHWHKLNPDHKPTLLFAPGVKESLWFAKEFAKEGVAAAHIDGGSVYFNDQCVAYAGQTFKGAAGIEAREEVFAMSRDGNLPIITNRFVAREALDLPWLEYCIGATVFGSLASYIQAGSRVLTKSPGKEKAYFLDHGGNWHRHLSLNMDRDWPLGCTSQQISDVIRQEHISGERAEATCCPKCGAIRGAAFKHTGICQQCGLQYTQSVRPVIQRDGTLKRLEGAVYKRRRTYKLADAPAEWRKYYFRFRKAGMTFTQAEGMFALEHAGYYLPRTLPNMPKKAADWVRHIKDVPADALYTQHDAPYFQDAPATPQKTLPGGDW